MHGGGRDRWGAACLRARVINSQDAGQRSALGVVGANNRESNHQLSHGLRRFLLEYQLHIRDSFIYFGRF